MTSPTFLPTVWAGGVDPRASVAPPTESKKWLWIGGSVVALLGLGLLVGKLRGSGGRSLPDMGRSGIQMADRMSPNRRYVREVFKRDRARKKADDEKWRRMKAREAKRSPCKKIKRGKASFTVCGVK